MVWLKLEDREKIHFYIKSGLSLSEISRKIYKPKNTVVTEVRRNGGRELYDPVEAQNYHVKLREEANLKRSKKTKNQENNFLKWIKIKIQNIEFQLDILSDVIKQLNQKQHEND